MVIDEIYFLSGLIFEKSTPHLPQPEAQLPLLGKAERYMMRPI